MEAGLFERFKSDLVALESRLAVETSDPLADLHTASSYIQTARGVPSQYPEDWRRHLLVESIPKLVRAVMKRKFSGSAGEQHAAAAQNFLCICAVFLEKFTTDINFVHTTIAELLDPSQQFYKTYGFPKVPAQQGSVHSSMDYNVEWIAKLEVDCYIDAQNDQGVWELVRIAGISPTCTELEVEWQGDVYPQRQWFSVQTHCGRLAECGTKSLAKTDEPADSTNTIATYPSLDQKTSAMLVEDGARVGELGHTYFRMGTLLDSQDKQGIWYQAVVMEARTEDIAISAVVATGSNTCTAGVQPVDLTVAKATALTDEEEVELDKKLSSPSSAMVVEAEAVRDSMLASESVASASYSDIHATHPSQPLDVPLEEGAQTDVAALSTSTIPDCSPSGNAPIKQQKIFLRIAYLGWSETCDEWIVSNSVRLAPFCSQSQGRRGPLAVREEILFVIPSSELMQEDDSKSFALLRSHCFLSPFYVAVVDSFQRGFGAILRYLDGGSGRPTLSVALSLITATGNAASVFSKLTLAFMVPRLIPLVSTFLSQLTLAELRSLSTDALDACLSALEALCVAYLGRTAAMGEMIEPLFLQVAMTSVCCPYLIARLGGLKMLTEIINRANATRDCPTGLKITRSVSSTGQEAISYRVVQVLHHLSAAAICKRIAETNAMEMIFRGDQAHASLIARSGEVLKSLASEGMLTARLTEAVWEAGLGESQGGVALQVLGEVVAFMEPVALHALLGTIDMLDFSRVTTGIVDVVAATALRCRSILIHNPCDSKRSLALSVHCQSLRRLWLWVDTDSKDTAATVVECCLTKMETIFELGLPPSDSLLTKSEYPWNTHWLRCQDAISWSVQSVDKYRSVVPALRVLRAIIESWPQGMTGNAEPSSEAHDLPFAQPTCGNMALYLNESHDIVELVTKAIISLKEQQSEMASKLALSRGQPTMPPPDVQCQLNELLIGGSNVGYTRQLTHCLEFIHAFVRFNDTLAVSRSVIERIWSAVVTSYSQHTCAEIDAVVAFVGNIVLRVPSMSLSLDSTHKIAPRISVSDFETAQWVFMTLLCDMEGFVASPLYSSSALFCTEKLFRWINAQLGNIVELNNGKFVIIKRSQDLFGTDVYYQVVLVCRSNDVAESAVRLLTALPQSLSYALFLEGELRAVRSMLLQRCIDGLKRCHRDTVDKADFSSSQQFPFDRSLHRLLMLIHGILDESFRDLGDEIRPLGALSKGLQMSVKVHYTGKLKHLTRDLDVYINDTVESLLDKIAHIASRTSKDLRVHFCARLIESTDRHKTLAQMKVCQGGNCAFMVSEKQVSTGARDGDRSISAGGSISVKASPLLSVASVEDRCVAEDPESPALVLSRSKEYMDLLFDLLESCRGSICDEIWGLLVRLPSAPPIVAMWVGLDCRHVGDILHMTPAGNPSGDRMHIGRLLYNLKVIEWLLQSSDSALQTGLHSSRGERDATLPELTAWPAKFAAMGGFSAIAHVISPLALALDKFLSTDEAEGADGVTSSLLLDSLSLVLRISRAISIREAADLAMSRPSPADAKVLLNFLTEWSVDHTDTLSHFSGIQTENATSMIGPVLPPLVPTHSDAQNHGLQEAKSSAAESAENKSAPLLQEHSMLKSLLSKEWGWRLGVVGAHPASTPEHMQASAISVLALIKRFSLQKEFHLNTLEKGLNIRQSDVADRQKSLVGLIHDAVCCWTCAAVTNPEVLNCIDVHSSPSHQSFVASLAASHERIDASAMLKAFYLGTKDSPSASLDSKLVRLVSQALHCMVDWSYSLLGGFSMIAEKLFLASVIVRPRLCSSGSIPSSADGKMKSAECYANESQAILGLALFILDRIASTAVNSDTQGDIPSNDGGDSSLSVLTADMRIQLCSEIVTELKDASRVSAQGNEMIASRASHLTLTLRLLHALSRGREAILKYLLDQSVLVLLLCNCLGLPSWICSDVSIPSVSIPVLRGRELCRDDASRDAAYAIVLSLCDHDRALAARLQRSIHSLHQNVPTPSSFLYRPEREARSATGYVGLRNMGCTCYMNALLQTLFMVPTVRQGLLAMDLNEAAMTPAEIDDHLLVQLQRIIVALTYSEKKSHSPEAWMRAYKDETGLAPVNVSQQQDAQEFLSILCERLEQLFPSSAESSTMQVVCEEGRCPAPPRVENLFQRAFGGRFTHQIMRQCPEGEEMNVDECSAGTNNTVDGASRRNMREKVDPFPMVDVAVRGLESLEASLEAMVSPERLEGYQWEQGDSTDSITSKRVCISHLSDTLLFHLKRFEYNYDSLRREKINDRFEFPMVLDMRPYTKEGLEDRGESRPESYYLYELGGVVVHTGSSDSGHYYSYIKEHNNEAEARWLEFNDSEVSEFSSDRIPVECFGGMKETHRPIDGGDIWMAAQEANPKSAYMLVYRRIHPIDAVSAGSEPSLSPSCQAIVQQIQSDNAAHASTLQVLSLPHISFCAALFKILQKGMVMDHTASSRRLHEAILHDSLDVLLKLFSRSAFTARVSDYFEVVHATLEHQRIERETETKPPCDSLQPDDDAAAAMSVDAPPIPPTSSVLPPPPPELPARSHPCEQVSQTVLSWLANETEFHTTRQLLYSPEKDTRMNFARVLLSLVQDVSATEDRAGGREAGYTMYLVCQEISFFTDTVAYAGLAQQSFHGDDGARPSSPMAVDDSDSVTATLTAAAASLSSLAESSDRYGSRESKYAGCSTDGEPDTKKRRELTPSAAGACNQADLGGKSPFLVAKFLCILTSKPNMLLIAENFRKSDAITWLLKKLVALGWGMRAFLVKREIISELTDIVLGDQSPLCGVQYTKGDRKRCPSSFVLVWPLKDGTQSAAARAIPDWGDLLDALTSLICSCRTPAMIDAADKIARGAMAFSAPLTLESSGPVDPPPLEGFSLECAANRFLLGILLRQVRYCNAASRLVQHLSYESTAWTDTVCTSLIDAFSLTTIEATSHLFHIAECFLCIEDSVAPYRTSYVFSPMMGITEALKAWKDDAAKEKLVCVCIRSFVTLVHRCPPRCKEFLTTPKSRTHGWAGWMTSFCHAFHAKCDGEAYATGMGGTGMGGTGSVGASIESSCRDSMFKHDPHILRSSGDGASAICAFQPAAEQIITNVPSPFVSSVPGSASSPSTVYSVLAAEGVFRAQDIVVDNSAAAHSSSNSSNQPSVQGMLSVRRLSDGECGTVTAANTMLIDLAGLAAMAGTAALSQAKHIPAPASYCVPSVPSSLATSSAQPSAATSKGPYLVLYGEDEGERESSWLVRSEVARDVLVALLLETGTDAEVDLLTAEAVAGLRTSSSSSSSSSSAVVLGSHVNSHQGLGTQRQPFSIDDDVPALVDLNNNFQAASSGDYMTEEQLQIFMASMTE